MYVFDKWLGKNKARPERAELIKIADAYFRDNRLNFDKMTVEAEVVGGSITITYVAREDETES